MNQDVYTLFARIYSSEVGDWSEKTQMEEPAIIDSRQPSVVLGNSVYLACFPGATPEILEYDMAGGKGGLSLIEPPLQHRNQLGVVLVPMEAGTLGFVGIRESKICLWSREVDPQHGNMAWAHHKTIELETLLLPRPKIKPHVLGYAEGLGIIFVSLNSGVFSIELKSGNTQKVPYPGRIRELRPGENLKLFPYMSFCTPGSTS
jgi:hypothetical protein